MESNNKDDFQFPRIPLDVLEELNKRFPEHCADLQWEEKQVWFMSGQRAVVRFLNHIYQIQNENPLS